MSKVFPEEVKAKEPISKEGLKGVHSGISDKSLQGAVWNFKLSKPFEVKALFFLSWIGQELKYKTSARSKLVYCCYATLACALVAQKAKFAVRGIIVPADHPCIK